MSVGRQPSAAPAAPAAPAAWRGARRVPGAAGAPRIPAPPRGRLPLALPLALPSLLPLIVVLLVLLAPERSWSGPTGVALLCSRVAGLSARQRAMCRASPDAMVAIGTGLRLALQECQHQFRYERWNCSSGPHPGHHHSLPLVVRVASREAAFSLAVQAAAVSWATAAACARGELSGCSCAKRAPGQHHPGHGLGHGVGHGPGPAAVDPASSGAAVAFRWGGCSSDVEYGAKLSRTFTDAAHHGDGPGNAAMASRLLMDSHNSKAGRKAVKLTLQTDCKCHGVSGSCSIRTCWTSLAPFRAVGDHLMARYRAAWPAVALPLPQGPGPAGAAGAAGARSRRHPVGLRLALRSGRNSRAPPAPHAAPPAPPQLAAAPRLPRRSDLVFLQGSPNYCDPDAALGSLGTAGRACNRTSRGADGCGVMCCGRGYDTRQVTSSRQCHCKFHWCCYVHCDVCTDRYEEYTCK